MIASNPTRGKVLVFGFVFWYPLAGVTYQFLHYLLGLRRLGYDCYYVEDSARWVYNPKINDLSPEAEKNIQVVAPVLDAFGFAGRWAFRGQYPGGGCYGMTENQLSDLYREADAFLNVTGAQELRDEHLTCPRRIYVETDPVASQIQVAQGNERTIASLAAHNQHFSFGENFGSPDCGVPIERFGWLPTRQPVLLDMWDGKKNTISRSNSLEPSSTREAYTTITTWQNKGRDVTYRGETYYWSKDREFRKFIDLPRRTSVPIELAMGPDKEARDVLRNHGWRQADSFAVSKDVNAYRDYIQASRGEFTVAKDQNIRLRSGWFSDRSACYLAAGRPVITQETGFSNILPTGRGLFGFTSMDDILAAIEAIESNYPAHCEAARDIAREYFAAEKVLAHLLEQAG